MTLKIRRLHELALMPRYAHPNDSGLDLFSVEDIDIPARESKLIHTGIAIELPPGTEAQIRPRSGLALNHQISILNTPGTVDEGYRGEIKLVLINHGKRLFRVRKGMKVAQMVIAPVIHVEIEEVEELATSLRGDDAFGSTGLILPEEMNQ
jgi:dUTP pyrophosphatase